MPVASEFRARDKQQEYQSKVREDSKRKTKLSDLKPNDIVLMKIFHSSNKLSTPHCSERFKIVDKNGSNVTVESGATGKSYHIHSSHLHQLSQYEDQPNASSQADLFMSPRSSDVEKKKS